MQRTVRQPPAGQAAITSLTLASTGVTVAASAEYEHGIGRVEFLLVDLTGGSPPEVIVRRSLDLDATPARVAERWGAGVALGSGVAYRVFFNVYDRTGVGLVGYDRRDFTWCRRREQ